MPGWDVRDIDSIWVEDQGVPDSLQKVILWGFGVLFVCFVFVGTHLQTYPSDYRNPHDAIYYTTKGHLQQTVSWAAEEFQVCLLNPVTWDFLHPWLVCLLFVGRGWWSKGSGINLITHNWLVIYLISPPWKCASHLVSIVIFFMQSRHYTNN